MKQSPWQHWQNKSLQNVGYNYFKNAPDVIEKHMFLWRSLCLAQFFLLLGLLTFMGLTPAPDVYAPVFNDKLMHFSGYLVAGFSISFAYPHTIFWQRILFLILFSIGIEVGQHFMPPRTFELLDICANSMGVIAGILIVTKLEKNVVWFKSFLLLSRQ